MIRSISVRVAVLAVVSSFTFVSAAFLPIIDKSRRTRRHMVLSPPRTFPKTVPRGGNTSPTVLCAVVFDNGPFWQAQSMLAGANALGLAISLATGSHLHLDLVGTGAFALSATVPFSIGAPMLPRVKWSSIAVFTWGAKLAGFLFFRALKVKKDARLTDTLSTSGGTAMFWALSWLWGAVCSLPYTLGTTSSSPGNATTFRIGACIYVAGLVTETLADYQKWMFKQSNPGQFCDVGVWSLSQHPNFFGNLLIWFGIFIMNAPALVDPEAQSFFGMYKRVGLALLSPLFMFSFFFGQASGTISSSVEMFETKYGKEPGFQEYVDNTPLIIPNPFKRSTS